MMMLHCGDYSKVANPVEQHVQTESLMRHDSTPSLFRLLHLTTSRF